MDLPIKVILHRAEEGGFWATVPAMPGCVTEADTKEDLVRNLREALEGWLGASQGHPWNTTSTSRERSSPCEASAVGRAGCAGRAITVGKRDWPTQRDLTTASEYTPIGRHNQ